MYNNLYNIFTNNYICASNTASLQRENEKYKKIIASDKKKYNALKKDYTDLVDKYIELENQYVCLELKYEEFLNNVFTNDDYIFEDTDNVKNTDIKNEVKDEESNEVSEESNEVSEENNEVSEASNEVSEASNESYVSNASNGSNGNLSDEYETI